MQLSQLFTTLALAMTASALPAGENVDKLAPRTEQPVPSCTNNQQPVCCNSILPVLGNILCAVSVLGGTCEGSTYCCSTTAAPVRTAVFDCWENRMLTLIVARVPLSTFSSSTASTSARRGDEEPLGCACWSVVNLKGLAGYALLKEVWTWLETGKER